MLGAGHGYSSVSLGEIFHRIATSVVSDILGELTGVPNAERTRQRGFPDRDRLGVGGGELDRPYDLGREEGRSRHRSTTGHRPESSPYHARQGRRWWSPPSTAGPLVGSRGSAGEPRSAPRESHRQRVRRVRRSTATTLPRPRLLLHGSCAGMNGRTPAAKVPKHLIRNANTLRPVATLPLSWLGLSRWGDRVPIPKETIHG